jgi:Cu2+-exporting ATPase
MYRPAHPPGPRGPSGAIACFHCGDGVRPSSRWTADIAQASRRFCCAGCLAVAQTIHRAGLDAFYRDRIAAPPRAFDEASPPGGDAVWSAHDSVAARCGLTREQADGTAEVALLIEGVTCGACVWLLERWLSQQAGVCAVDVNLALRRARVRFRPDVLPLSRLIAAVAAVGYAAHPYDPSQRETRARLESRTLWRRAAVALLAMMQVMMLALPSYMGDDVSDEQRRLLDWASLTLTLPVMLYCAAPFFRTAWRGVRTGHIGMDLPVALALLGAFAASVWATWRGTGVTYYDSITMFVALLLTARALEAMARNRACAALERTAHALPAVAERYRAWPDDTALESVPAHALVPGDVVLVRPGAPIPADGSVLGGRSHVEQSWLTGEAQPVLREPRDTVLAGSVNRESALVVRVRKTGNATELATLTRLVTEAAGARPPLAQLADRAAAAFVVAMLALAAMAAAYWIAVDASRAFAITFAVLAVSCPCALSLATPAALTAAAGALARRHVVLTRGAALETLARVNAIAFDKTGTLTSGRIELVDYVALRPLSRDEALAIAAALEADSEHPLARALCRAAPRAYRAILAIMTVGEGVEGHLGAHVWRIGRPEFAAWQQIPKTVRQRIAQLPDEGAIVALGDERGIAALFVLSDALRRDARESVDALRAAGIAPLMLSGDRESNARAVGAATGIEDARGGLLPAQKRNAITTLQARGECVAMVGDGVNDAPALAQADVAVSLGSAAPLAQCTADVVLLSGRLGDLPAVLALARRTRRIVRQNVAWALVYNALAIPAAALGWITPLAASVGMSVSSLVVVANALRAGRMKT